jgi:sterol desaturase/sphingolipid hydroxylase (fatty acid hydroxylase superfamily)
MQWRGCSFSAELPTFQQVAWELFVFVWVEEFGFYYSHRYGCCCYDYEIYILLLFHNSFLHHPLIYKHVHKIHHEWTAPIGTLNAKESSNKLNKQIAGIIGVYAHPFEVLLSNSLPLMMGPFICGSHVATAMMWFVMAIFSTTIAHSGYHMPFLPSPEAHDFHHLKYVCVCFKPIV